MRSVVSFIKNGADTAFSKTFNGHVDQTEKIPRYVHFRPGLLHIKDSSKKIGKSYKLQESLLEEELCLVEIYEDSWEEKENKCLPYLKTDVLSTASSYAIYSKSMEELTMFGMKNS